MSNDSQLDDALGSIEQTFGAPLCGYCHGTGEGRPSKGVEYTELDSGEARFFCWAPCLMSWLKAKGAYLVSRDTNDHHNKTKIQRDTRPRVARFRR